MTTILCAQCGTKWVDGALIGWVKLEYDRFTRHIPEPPFGMEYQRVVQHACSLACLMTIGEKCFGKAQP